MPNEVGDRIVVGGRSYVRATNDYFQVTVQDLEWTDCRRAGAQGGTPDRTITGRAWTHAERIGVVGVLDEPGFVTGEISIGSAGEDSTPTMISLRENSYGKLYPEDDAMLMIFMIVALPAEVFDAVWVALVKGDADSVSIALIADFYELEALPGDRRLTEWYLTSRRDDQGRLLVDPVEGKVISASFRKQKREPIAHPAPVTNTVQVPVEVIRAANVIRWALPAIAVLLVLILVMLTR